MDPRGIDLFRAPQKRSRPRRVTRCHQRGRAFRGESELLSAGFNGNPAVGAAGFRAMGEGDSLARSRACGRPVGGGLGEARRTKAGARAGCGRRGPPKARPVPPGEQFRMFRPRVATGASCAHSGGARRPPRGPPRRPKLGHPENARGEFRLIAVVGRGDPRYKMSRPAAVTELNGRQFGFPRSVFFCAPAESGHFIRRLRVRCVPSGQQRRGDLCFRNCDWPGLKRDHQWPAPGRAGATRLPRSLLPATATCGHDRPRRGGVSRPSARERSRQCRDRRVP